MAATQHYTTNSFFGAYGVTDSASTKRAVANMRLCSLSIWWASAVSDSEIRMESQGSKLSDLPALSKGIT
tara:strand:+ start:982 stop:1191 length:210 start_codon:yes stop_codon:yes gene_type:complete